MQQSDDVTFMMWFVGAVEEAIADVRSTRPYQVVRANPKNDALVQLALQYLEYSGEIENYTKVPGVGTQPTYNVHWSKTDDAT